MYLIKNTGLIEINNFAIYICFGHLLIGWLMVCKLLCIQRFLFHNAKIINNFIKKNFNKHVPIIIFILNMKLE